MIMNFLYRPISILTTFARDGRTLGVISDTSRADPDAKLSVLLADELREPDSEEVVVRSDDDTNESYAARVEAVNAILSFARHQ